jgi:hypothetical protein
MAGVIGMKRLIVIDTGYLYELYQIKGNNAGKYKEALQRFIEAKNRGDSFFVPTTVIFELANHIAHIQDEEWRKKLVDDIQISIKMSKPYTIVPCSEFSALDNLAKSLTQFSQVYAAKGLGPTDTSVFLEADRLKKKYPKSHPLLVHIWTTDKPLKRLEPDSEPNPFI